MCRIGKDGKLYVALGQPFNVTPKEKVDLYAKLGIGGIIRLNAFDGSGREVYARGIRNSVGMDFNPKNGELWFTDNQVDGMGEDTPPGELDRITKAGQPFGYPWYGGGKVRTNEYKDSKPPADAVFPEQRVRRPRRARSPPRAQQRRGPHRPSRADARPRSGAGSQPAPGCSEERGKKNDGE